MDYSLEEVINKLETFASRHKQVNSFTMKDPLELLNCSEELFPAILSVLQPATIQENYVFLNMDLYFCDLVHKDLSNEFIVISDQMLIAMDLRAYFNNEENDDKFIVTENSRLEPFYEKGNNELTGVKMSFQLRIFDKKDYCQIPLD